MRRLKYPKSKGAIFRKTYPEIEKNHIRRIFEELPQLRQFYQAQNRAIIFPNGSSLEFCYCESIRDIDRKFQGQEWDDLSIDEAGEWLEDEYVRLSHCNRPTGAGIQPRMYSSANPGGRGHAHLKRKFITGNYRENERPERYHFIQSLVNDNPALLDEDPDYIHTLEAEPNPMLRKAFLYGDWDIEAGTYFSDLNREVHVEEAFNIPDHWPRYFGYDYGYNHPCAWIWTAIDEDGVMHVYREWVESEQAIDEQSDHVNQYPETKAEIWRAGKDCFHKKVVFGKGAPPTIAEQFNEFNISLTPANVQRVAGASQIRQRLRYRIVEIDGKKKQVGPLIKFSTACPITYDCLTRMIHDTNNVEDVLKVDASNGDVWTGDDPYDALRHVVMARPIAAIKPKEKNKDAWAEDDKIEKERNAWVV